MRRKEIEGGNGVTIARPPLAYSECLRRTLLITTVTQAATWTQEFSIWQACGCTRSDEEGPKEAKREYYLDKTSRPTRMHPSKSRYDGGIFQQRQDRSFCPSYEKEFLSRRHFLTLKVGWRVVVPRDIQIKVRVGTRQSPLPLVTNGTQMKKPHIGWVDFG